MLNASTIKELSAEHGFEICGVTPATALHENRGYFNEWLSNGYAEPIPYMYKYRDVRFDPSQLLVGARSVIVCGVSYKNEYSTAKWDRLTPRIASYALCRDYHKTLRKRLKALLRDLQRHYPALQGRCFTDSAPLLEKQLAVNCGIGWIGRQSLIISPQYGSFILLGEIVIDGEVDCYDTPYIGNGCGECRRCVEACPTHAINPNRTIDTRLCISCQTVECDNDSSLSLSGWIFGCDECQSCCPHNRSTPFATNPEHQPIAHPLSAEEWQEISEGEFIERFGSTPLKRAGVERLKKNTKESD